MLNQNDFKDKFSHLKQEARHIWDKFVHRSSSVYDQADGIVDVDHVRDKGDATSLGDINEFTPEEKVATAPRTTQILSDGSNEAQNLVWENEDASMQDKSYSFDEETTDADYDFEDDLDFYDDNDESRGRHSI